MRPHALSSHGLTGVPSRRSTSGWSLLLRFVLDRYLLLPIGVVVALVWANTAGESYFRVAHALAFPVNEIGMALFLGLIAQETLEAVMPGGALHTWRRWGTPLVGAGGGMLGAAFVFLAYVYWSHEQVLAQAWPIALSIDIAAAYYVAKLIFRGTHALAFLLVLAAASDAVGLLLATWKPMTPERLFGVLPLLAAVASAAMMRRARVRSPWPYIAVSGTLSWWGCYLAGAHPALALLPVVPFLPREPRTIDPFADAPDDDALHHAEHQWHEAVQVVLFLFGVVNGGVLLSGYDTGTWAILAAALVGRPLGILAAVALARPVGLRLPRGVDWKGLIVIAFATSSGFTLALFFAPALLPPGAVLQQIKVGTLATAGGAALALATAALLRTGRLDRTTIPRDRRWHTY